MGTPDSSRHSPSPAGGGTDPELPDGAALDRIPVQETTVDSALGDTRFCVRVNTVIPVFR